MPGLLDDEIRGDWNNLKGTAYHLAYALWLLLPGRAAGVSFYRGNDLFARPIAPPTPSTVGTVPPVAVHQEGPDEDIWIQLKATEDYWTLGALLDPILLANFICNALESERRGRRWRIWLITQGNIDHRGLDEFIADPASRSRLRDHPAAIATKVRDRWAAAAQGPLDEARLAAATAAVLRQLAETRPVQLAALRAEVENHLLGVYPDRETARRIASTLLGAMLDDAAAGPGRTPVYDAAWLDHASGHALGPGPRLPSDPVGACAEVSRRAMPRDWQVPRHARRPRLERALVRYLRSPETLFVLLGVSGVGKSWAVAAATQEVLAGRLPLLLAGTALDERPNLAALVGAPLRRLSPAGWTDEVILRRLTAAAVDAGRGPLVVIVNGLLPPNAGEEARAGRYLATLTGECRDTGVKLMITCQRSVWELHRLSRAIPTDRIFQAEAEPGQAREDYSFLLDVLTPEEQADMLARRLTADRAARAADELRAPAFIPLRNPFLLERYLEQHGERLGRRGGEPAPVDNDALLEGRVRSALASTAAALGRDEDDVRAAVEALLEHLWSARPSGVAHAEAVRRIEEALPGQGGAALGALREAGLLAPGGQTRLAETAVVEYLFAARIWHRLRVGEPVLPDLRPADDGGVVVALLRRAADDAIGYAEQLLEQEVGWREPVAAGLAQGRPGDYRALALLSILARPIDGHIVDTAGCAALGQLAARSDVALRWSARMYLDDRQVERYRGGWALFATIDLAPSRVEALLRLRLSRAARIGDFHHADRERRHRWLQGALTPLFNIRHSASARTGRRVLDRYASLAGRRPERLDQDFGDDVDAARGAIAIAAGRPEIDRLLGELRGEDAIARRRAATALRPVAFDRPDLVADALCGALRDEDDLRVLERVLAATFPLVEAAPDTLLDALAARLPGGWRALGAVAGLLLALLGNLASSRPDRVVALLPTSLADDYEPWARACMSEMLAYAWWGCVDRGAAAKSVLAALAETDRADLTEDMEAFIPFALRGVAIARLGAICAGDGSVAELAGRQIPYGGVPALYLDADDFVRHHVDTIMDHSGREGFVEALLAALREEHRARVHPVQRELSEAQYRCADQSLEMLLPLALAQADPVPLLRALPRDWPALRAGCRLLQAGRTESAIVAFVEELCAARAVGETMSLQAWHERELCLAQLARLHAEPRAALADYRAAVARTLGTSGTARGLIELTDRHPERTLELLDASIGSAADLPLLYNWEEETRSWRSLLIARVHARMFDPRAITVAEGRELSEQMLTALRSLPKTAERREWLAVYGAIAGLIRGDTLLLPSLPQPVSAVQHVHVWAVALLGQSDSAGTQEEARERLLNAAADHRSWWDTTAYALREGSFSEGNRLYLVYAFPVVRLALVALGQRLGLRDPAGRVMEERTAVVALFEEHRDAVQPWPGREANQDRLERALAAFAAQERRTPRDARLSYWQGDVFLRLGRLDEAGQHLHACLAMPSCDAETRGLALYDLACVCAHLGQEEECWEALRRALDQNPRYREWLDDDPDFAEVRDRTWFQTLRGEG